VFEGSTYFGGSGLTLGNRLTVSFWVELTGIGDNPIVSFIDSLNANNNFVIYGSVVGGNLTINAGNLTNIDTSIALDGLTHVAVTANGTSGKVYINGVFVVNITIPVSKWLTHDEFYIGYDGTEFLDGIVDDVVVFNGDLSKDEISKLALSPSLYQLKKWGALYSFKNREEVIDEINGLELTVVSPNLSVFGKEGINETPQFLSRWNAGGGELPLLYKIENDLFPTNKVDTVFDIIGATESLGRTSIETSADHLLDIGDLVFHKDCENESYNGTYRVVQIDSPTVYIVGVAFVGDETQGSTQKRYENYAINVTVYAGLSDTHPLSELKPIEEIGKLSVQPDTDNISYIDIVELVKSKLSIQNPLFKEYYPVDLSAFTYFYVEVSETYRVGGITIFESTPTVDSINSCAIDTELFTDPNFDNELTSWEQLWTQEEWIAGVNEVTSSFSTQPVTKTLTQTGVTIRSGVGYRIEWDSDFEGYKEVVLLFVSYKGGVLRIRSSDKSGVINRTFLGDYPLVGIYIVSLNGIDSSDVSLSKFSITESSCNVFLFATNSTKQFQNKTGGSMGDYEIHQLAESKFMTDFDKPVLFKGYPFALSTIITKESLEGSLNADSLYIRNITEGVDYKIDTYGDGVYRVGGDLDSDLEEIDVEIYSVPQNYFTLYSNGTFEDNTEVGIVNFNSPETGTVNILKGISLSNAYSGRHSYLVSSPEFTFSPLLGGSLFPVQDIVGGLDYIVSAKIQINNFNQNDLDDTYLTLWVLDSSNNRICEDEVFIPYNGGGWQSFSKKVSIPEGVTSYKIAFFKGGTTSAYGVLSANIDNIQVVGPYEKVSETKTIRIDNECGNSEIYLTWFNSLGGWEQYVFKAKKAYKRTIEGSKSIRRDVFNDWDNSFINGESDFDFTEIDTYKTITVRSQHISLSEKLAVEKIKTSIKVQMLVDDTLTTVRVDKGSFTIYEDVDKLHTIEFDIDLPLEYIQTI
jgi:hypothetical protein